MEELDIIFDDLEDTKELDLSIVEDYEVDEDDDILLLEDFDIKRRESEQEDNNE